jgi:hypothetical protein
LVYVLAARFIEKTESAPRDVFENQPAAAHEFQINRVGTLVNPEYSEHANLRNCGSLTTVAYRPSFIIEQVPLLTLSGSLN